MGPLRSVIPGVLENPLITVTVTFLDFRVYFKLLFPPPCLTFSFSRTTTSLPLALRPILLPSPQCYASQEEQRVYQKVLLLLTSCWVQPKGNPLTTFLKRRKEKVRFGYFSPTLSISLIVGWQKSPGRDHSFCQTTLFTQLSFPNCPPFLLIPPQVRTGGGKR